MLRFHFSLPRLAARLPWAVVTAAFLLGCTTGQRVSVTTDYDKSTDFSRYHTFDWYQTTPVAPRPSAGAEARAASHTVQATGATTASSPAAASPYDSFADRRIRAALEAQLPAKGLTHITRRPDLKIAYDITVKQEQQPDPGYAFAPGFGYGYSSWYGYRYNYGFNRFGPGAYPPVSTYNVGTVVVDFVDAKANELVWRGVGESVVDPGAVSEEAIAEIIRGILAKYPPQK